MLPRCSSLHLFLSLQKRYLIRYRFCILIYLYVFFSFGSQLGKEYLEKINFVALIRNQQGIIVTIWISSTENPVYSVFHKRNFTIKKFTLLLHVFWSQNWKSKTTSSNILVWLKFFFEPFAVSFFDNLAMLYYFVAKNNPMITNHKFEMYFDWI